MQRISIIEKHIIRFNFYYIGELQSTNLGQLNKLDGMFMNTAKKKPKKAAINFPLSVILIV